MSKTFMILLTACLLAQLTVCQVLSGHELLLFKPSLQFRNKTGQGLTPQQMQSFIAIANYASSVYGSNVEKNLKYIKLRMDELYGKANFNFYVFIQTDQEVMAWRIFVIADQVYATVEGINKLFPKWSYFFTRNLGSNFIPDYAYFHWGIGTGFTRDLLNKLDKLILEQEGDECACDVASLEAIGDGLYIETSLAWSVVCDNLGASYSLIHSYQDLWVAIKSKNCYYTVFT